MTELNNNVLTEQIVEIITSSDKKLQRAFLKTYPLCKININLIKASLMLYDRCWNSIRDLNPNMDDYWDIKSSLLKTKENIFYFVCNGFIEKCLICAIDDFKDIVSLFVERGENKHLIKQLKLSQKKNKRIKRFKTLNNFSTNNIYLLEPQKLVNYLTSYSFGYYKKWTTNVLLDFMMGKGSIIIEETIEFFNKISYWIATSIMRATDIKEQKKIVDYFLKCALLLRLQNNFHMLFSIISGLQNISVSRLDYLWQKKNRKRNLDKLSKLISNTSNYRLYRSVIEELHNFPFIPYFGLLMSDLTFLAEAEIIVDSIINKEVLCKINEVIENNLKGKNKEYNFELCTNLSFFFENVNILDDDMLYEISCKWKPTDIVNNTNLINVNKQRKSQTLNNEKNNKNRARRRSLNFNANNDEQIKALTSSIISRSSSHRKDRNKKEYIEDDNQLDHISEVDRSSSARLIPRKKHSRGKKKLLNNMSLSRIQL